MYKNKPIAFLIKQQKSSESGFTLMEVIVAALIVFFFVAGSMQALALSVAIRVKAQENQKANQLIQEDIEQIRLLAENMARNSSLCDADTYIGGYAQALAATLPANGANRNLIEGNTNSKQIQINRTINDETNANPSTSSVLKLNYSVFEVGRPTNEIATDYIEVIPNAVSECP